MSVFSRLSLGAMRTRRLPSRSIRESGHQQSLIGQIVHPALVGRNEDAGRGTVFICLAKVELAMDATTGAPPLATKALTMSSSTSVSEAAAKTVTPAAAAGTVRLHNEASNTRRTDNDLNERMEPPLAADAYWRPAPAGPRLSPTYIHSTIRCRQAPATVSLNSYIHTSGSGSICPVVGSAETTLGNTDGRRQPHMDTDKRKRRRHSCACQPAFDGARLMPAARVRVIGGCRRPSVLPKTLWHFEIHPHSSCASVP